MITWIHAGPSVPAAFLGSLVECVEAATIVLAVGTVRGWRSALAGALAGVAVLAGLVGLLGPALSTIPSPYSRSSSASCSCCSGSTGCARRS